MSKEKNFLDELFAMLDSEDFLNCQTCNTKRIEVRFEDLPEEPKRGFSKLMQMKEFKNGTTFLHCPKCQTYSIQSDFF